MPKAADIHRELLCAWNRRDFSAYRELLHADYTYTGGDGKEMKGGPDLGVHIGRMYAEAFPDAKLELKKVLALWRMIGPSPWQGEFGEGGPGTSLAHGHSSYFASPSSLTSARAI